MAVIFYSNCAGTAYTNTVTVSYSTYQTATPMVYGAYWKEYDSNSTYEIKVPALIKENQIVEYVEPAQILQFGLALTSAMPHSGLQERGVKRYGFCSGVG